MRTRRLASLALAAAALASVPGGARAGGITQDQCPGTTHVEVWKQLGNDVLENLLFDGDRLWVSDTSAGAIRSFDASGVEGRAVSPVSAPGGLAKGPDGLIYAGFGDSAATAALQTHAAGVITFDPADPAVASKTYASGFDMANGVTFGPNGDLFVSNDVGNGLIRIPREDPAGWSKLADLWGTNGLVVDPSGRTLYAAITFDQRSPIEAVSLQPPYEHRTAAQLTFGVASLEPAVYTDGDPSAPPVGAKGLDDMTRDGAGVLYVVANGMGELLRVDPSTGAACLMDSGFRNPSSVRIAPAAFGRTDTSLTLFVTEFSGAIRRVTYSPATPS
jgi:hypothetical protein